MAICLAPKAIAAKCQSPQGAGRCVNCRRSTNQHCKTQATVDSRPMWGIVYSGFAMSWAQHKCGNLDCIISSSGGLRIWYAVYGCILQLILFPTRDRQSSIVMLRLFVTGRVATGFYNWLTQLETTFQWKFVYKISLLKINVINDNKKAVYQEERAGRLKM